MLKLLRLRELLHQLWPHPAKRRTSATLRDSAPPARRCLPDSPRCRYPKASHLGSGMSRFTHTTLTAVAMSTVASAAVAAAAAAAAAPPPPLLLLLLLLAVPHFQLLLYSATGRNVVPADASTTTTIVATVTTTAYVAPPHTHSTPYPSPGTTSKSSRALNPETGEPSFSSVCVSSCMLSCGSRGAKRSAWKSPGVRLAMDSVWDLGFKFGFRVQPPAVAFSGEMDFEVRVEFKSPWRMASTRICLCLCLSLASGPASKFSGLGLVPCLSFYRASLMPSSLKPKSLRSQPTHSQPRVTRCRSDHRKPNISFVAPPALHPIYLPAFRHSHSDDRVEACDDESADVKPQIERLS